MSQVTSEFRLETSDKRVRGIQAKGEQKESILDQTIRTKIVVKKWGRVCARGKPRPRVLVVIPYRTSLRLALDRTLPFSWFCGCVTWAHERT